VRLLVACPACHHRYDASGHAAGERFRCSCGGVIEVPVVVPHESAVVRCSACGAPRSGEELACRYCGADFTVAERDLDAVCPECMTRVSRQARYCHDCGAPILRAQAGDAAAAVTGPACPACGGEHRLTSRALGTEERVALFDCGRCGGLWVEREVFETLAKRARQGKVPDFGVAHDLPAAAAGGRSAVAVSYRPCPDCGALMNRRNYERRSGVIVDLCRDHGIWFDLDELSRLLRWIHEGGPRRGARGAGAPGRGAHRGALSTHLGPRGGRLDGAPAGLRLRGRPLPLLRPVPARHLRVKG
jgi:Zn-finger nucleic acid-binding protein